MAVPAAVAVTVIAGAAFTLLLKPLGALSGAPIDIGSLVVSGSKIMMQQPRLAGFTRDNRRYNMVAQAAAQDLTKPDMVELHGVHATMEMKDKVTFETTAKGGLYNSKTEQLTLSHDIVVTSSSGYQAFLNEAVLDVRAGKIVSDQPVEVKTATWTINANRMEVAESGDLMRFERGVSVTLLLDSTTSGMGGAGSRK
jgi:lipopolysaccharide export system protein LptC